MTPESLSALAQLRRVDHFEWHAISALAFVLYAYASAARRNEWGNVALGIGFWAAELIWEMFNALVLHFSGFAALWTLAGKSALLIYVGLNIEISMMFAVAPLVLFNLLPEDRELRVAGISNRTLIPVLLGLFCVFVECALYRIGALVWAWPLWRFPNIALIAVAYCVPFRVLVWIHDHVSLRAKIRGALAALALAFGCHMVLAEVLGWV